MSQSQLKENLKFRKQTSDPSNKPDTKSSKRSIETSKSTISSRGDKLKPILISTTPGNAIMGYAVDDAPSKKLPPLQEVNPNRNLNKDLEARVESEIIAMLQAKCSELAKEAEEDKASKKQAEIENCMLRSQIANMEKDMRHLSIMVNDEKSEKGKYEENSEKMREMLNKANREIAKLKQDVKVANENSGISKREFEEFKREKESEARSYEAEIDRLRKHLDELEEEHEELKNHLQVKSEINTRVEAERKEYIKEMENKTTSEIEAKLEKIHKLMHENVVLTEKLAESEKLRRKFQERHAYQEERIKSLVEKNQSIENCVGSLKKQLTDAKSLKSYNHKIYEDKIVALNEQIEKLKKENAKVRKSNIPTSPTAKIDDNEPVLEPVQARPFLFGPVDTGKF